MGMTKVEAVAGTVKMSNGTRRAARALAGGQIEFATFGNANASRGRAWRTATDAQAATFTADK